MNTDPGSTSRAALQRQTPDTMLTNIFRHPPISETLTGSDVARLRHSLAVRAQTVQHRMEQALARRDIRKFKHLCTDAFASSGLRLWAHFKAVPERKAVRVALSRRVRECSLIDPFAGYARPWRRELPKPEPGQYREVFEFEPLDQARFYLVKLALDAIARAHPTLRCNPLQTLSFGGRSTACNTLFQALQGAPSGACFVQIDIRGFYPSIASEHLEKVLPLPREVIHRCVLTAQHLNRNRAHDCEPTIVLGGEGCKGADAIRSSSGMTDVLEEGVAMSTPHTEGRGSRRRFVPTGSATASTAGEIVMGGVLGRVDHPEGVLAALVYSDNIGVLCANRASAEAARDAYVRELERFEGGPFRVRVSIRGVSAGFPFLGYVFRAAGGRAVAEPQPDRLQQFELRLNERLLRACSSTDFTYVELMVKSYVAAFPLWSNGDAYQRRYQMHSFAASSAN